MRQKLLFIFQWLFIFLVGVHFVISGYKIMTTTAPDFTVYYTAASRLIHGVSVYNPHHVFTNFGYPPVTALLFIPFTLFPYPIAQAMFFLISVSSFLISVWFVMKLVGIKFSWKAFLLISSFAFLAFPTKFTFGMGQDNYLALALLLAGVFFTTRTKLFLPILFVSFAFVVKPILSIFLLYFIFTKKWKISMSILTTIILISSVSLLFPKGASDTMQYIFIEVPKLFKESGGVVYYNQSLASFFAREFGNLFISTLALRIIELVIIATATIAVYTKKNAIFGLVILFSLLPLIDSYSWQHHFVFLLLPFLYAYKQIIQTKSYRLVFFFILAIAYILVGANIKTPTALQRFPQNLVLSHVAFGSLVLFFLLLFLARIPLKSSRNALGL